MASTLHKLTALQFWARLHNRLKYAIGAVAYAAFNTTVLGTCRAQPQEQRVAVVYPDLLGDVLMWLPYGQALCAHLRQRNLDVVLVCDESNRLLLQTALPDCQVVGVNRAAAFLTKPRLRMKWLRQLRGLGIGQILYMSYPRGPLNWGESMVYALGAPAMGFAASIRDRPKWELWWTNKRYFRLVETAGSESTAVDHANRYSAEFLQALGIDARKTGVAKLPNTSEQSPLNEDYWVMAPGASRSYKRWPRERFVAIAQTVAKLRPHWRCVIVGSAAERALCQAIAQELGPMALNAAGQTTVLELIDWVAHAEFLLGNDSGTGHIAAAVGTPAIVVVGGGHWGRCYPYDPAVAPVRVLPLAVGHPMSCYGCDWLCAHTTRTDRPFPCVEGVTVTAVEQAVRQIAVLSPYD